MLEARQLQNILKLSRWCLLKRKENLTEKQMVKLQGAFAVQLAGDARNLQKEDFQRFWEYRSPSGAACIRGRGRSARVTRLLFEPMKKVAMSS